MIEETRWSSSIDSAISIMKRDIWYFTNFQQLVWVFQQISDENESFRNWCQTWKTSGDKNSKSWLSRHDRLIAERFSCQFRNYHFVTYRGVTTNELIRSLGRLLTWSSKPDRTWWKFFGDSSLPREQLLHLPSLSPSSLSRLVSPFLSFFFPSRLVVRSNLRNLI
jgi:hypothetical protein